MDSMPLHVGDWTGSRTVALAGHVGASIYLRLLMEQWRSEDDGLPPEPEKLRVLANATPKEWKAVWPLLEKHFPLTPTGQRENLRMRNERQFYVERRNERSESGKRGSAKRWGVPSPIAEPIAERMAEPLAEPLATAWQTHSPVPVPVPVPVKEEEEAAHRRAPSSSSADLTAHFTEPTHRTTYDAVRRTMPNPDTFDAVLTSLANGMSAPRGKPLTWYQIGAGILEISGQPTPPPLTARVIAGYASKIPPEPSAPSSTPSVLPGTVLNGEHVIWAPGAFESAPTNDEVALHKWRVVGASADTHGGRPTTANPDTQWSSA